MQSLHLERSRKKAQCAEGRGSYTAGRWDRLSVADVTVDHQPLGKRTGWRPLLQGDQAMRKSRTTAQGQAPGWGTIKSGVMLSSPRQRPTSLRRPHKRVLLMVKERVLGQVLSQPGTRVHFTLRTFTVSMREGVAFCTTAPPAGARDAEDLPPPRLEEQPPRTADAESTDQLPPARQLALFSGLTHSNPPPAWSVWLRG